MAFRICRFGDVIKLYNWCNEIITSLILPDVILLKRCGLPVLTLSEKVIGSSKLALDFIIVQRPISSLIHAVRPSSFKCG